MVQYLYRSYNMKRKILFCILILIVFTITGCGNIKKDLNKKENKKNVVDETAVYVNGVKLHIDKEKQFKDIMCHEMIHYYLAYCGEDRGCHHGKKFKEMANRLNRKYGLKITPYLDLSKYKRRKGTPSFTYWLLQKIGYI